VDVLSTSILAELYLYKNDSIDDELTDTIGNSPNKEP
jgi:hypothetical protein